MKTLWDGFYGVVTVQQNRVSGEEDYGNEANTDRFSNISENKYRYSLNPK